jgi:hypothetical protein
LASHPIGVSVSTESSRTTAKGDCFKSSEDFSGKAQQGSLIRSKNFLPLGRPERMCLTAEQQSQIASAYEKAAADETLPSQLRTAFVKKAEWLRMLCQIEAAKLSAGLVSAVAETAPERRYLSLVEKLSRARACRGTT